MNVENEIKRLQGIIKEHAQNIAWLRKHREQLEAAPEGQFYSSGLDFDRLPHKEVIKAVRAIGGKWSKTATGGGAETSAKINYTTELDGKQVRCWAGEPPPSCRLVEVEETIPAQPARVVKVKKLVCHPELAAAIATARAGAGA